MKFATLLLFAVMAKSAFAGYDPESLSTNVENYKHVSMAHGNARKAELQKTCKLSAGAAGSFLDSELMIGRHAKRLRDGTSKFPASQTQQFEKDYRAKLSRECPAMAKEIASKPLLDVTPKPVPKPIIAATPNPAPVPAVVTASNPVATPAAIAPSSITEQKTNQMLQLKNEIAALGSKQLEMEKAVAAQRQAIEAIKTKLLELTK